MPSSARFVVRVCPRRLSLPLCLVWCHRRELLQPPPVWSKHLNQVVLSGLARTNCPPWNAGFGAAGVAPGAGSSARPSFFVPSAPVAGDAAGAQGGEGAGGGVSGAEQQQQQQQPPPAPPLPTAPAAAAAAAAAYGYSSAVVQPPQQQAWLPQQQAQQAQQQQQQQQEPAAAPPLPSAPPAVGAAAGAAAYGYSSAVMQPPQPHQQQAWSQLDHQQQQAWPQTAYQKQQPQVWLQAANQQQPWSSPASAGFSPTAAESPMPYYGAEPQHGAATYGAVAQALGGAAPAAVSGGEEAMTNIEL